MKLWWAVGELQWELLVDHRGHRDHRCRVGELLLSVYLIEGDPGLTTVSVTVVGEDENAEVYVADYTGIGDLNEAKDSAVAAAIGWLRAHLDAFPKSSEVPNG